MAQQSAVPQASAPALVRLYEQLPSVPPANLDRAAATVLAAIEQTLDGCRACILLRTEGDDLICLRLEQGELHHTESAPRQELTSALRGRELAVIGEGGGPADEGTQERLDAASATAVIAAPLFAGPTALGALAIDLPGPLPAEAPLVARAAAAWLGGPVALQHRTEAIREQRRALEADLSLRQVQLLETNRHLAEQGRLKDEVLVRCAHDLRTPLAAVAGHARALLSGQRGDLSEAARGSAEAVLRQVSHLLELVSTLLNLRALQSGQVPLRPTPTDLSALAGQCCDAISALAAERHIALLRRFSPDPALIAIDPVQMREVIENLLGNALKFTPPGGRVEMGVESVRDGIRLSVTDTGPGIPSDEVTKVFAPFFRGRESRSTAGSGLGLALSREIVDLHSGTLSVDTEVGRGARFVVELPQKPSEASATKPWERKRPLILLVDDDAVTREIVAELLGSGYEVLLANDGESAVHLARERLPDLIILDLFLPRLDGFAAMEQLKADPKTSELPVILISARGDELTKVRGLKTGAVDYLSKPFSGPELLARVERILKTIAQREALRSLAQTDALTGLPNYRAFRGRLEDEVKRARRYETALSCVMIDLDNLKAINDRFGHGLGNRAIVFLADRVRAELRETDFAARYGGDEFVVLLPHTGAQEAAVFAERVRSSVASRAPGGESPELEVMASFGVSTLKPELSSDELLRAADGALYRAKRSGKNQVATEGTFPPALSAS